MHPSQKHFAARTVSQTKVASMKPSTLFTEFWKGVDSIYKPFSREHIQLMLGREKESEDSDDCESPPANPLSSMECLLSCLLVPEGECEGEMGMITSRRRDDQALEATTPNRE